MSVFIVADSNFCESEGRDNMLINNWNSVVKKKDSVILLGDIVKGDYNWDRIKEIFNSLNGQVDIISIRSDEKNANKWEEILGKKCHKVTAAVKGKIDDRPQVIIIYPYLTPSLKDKDFKGTKIYGAAPRSITNQKEIFEDNILSISIDDWGLTPIAYENVPSMIDDMLLFERMENMEENLNEQKSV